MSRRRSRKRKTIASGSPINDISDELVLGMSEIPVITLDSDSDDDVVVLDSDGESSSSPICENDVPTRSERDHSPGDSFVVMLTDDENSPDTSLDLTCSITNDIETDQSSNCSIESSADSTDKSVCIEQCVAGDGSDEEKRLARDVHHVTESFRTKKFAEQKCNFFKSAEGATALLKRADGWYDVINDRILWCEGILRRADVWKSNNLDRSDGWSKEPLSEKEHNALISRLDLTVVRGTLALTMFERKCQEEGSWKVDISSVDSEWRRSRKLLRDMVNESENKVYGSVSFAHFTLRDVAERKCPDEDSSIRELFDKGFKDLIRISGKKTEMVSTLFKRLSNGEKIKTTLKLKDAAYRTILKDLDKIYKTNYCLPKGSLYRQLILNVATTLFYDGYTNEWQVMDPEHWKLLDRIPFDRGEIKKLIMDASN